MKISTRALILALSTAISGVLQGRGLVIIIGYADYIKKEFKLDNEPIGGVLVGLISITGAILGFLSGTSGMPGRRPMLVMTSVLFLFSSTVMLWSRGLTLILLSRIYDGFGASFSFLLVAVYCLELGRRGFFYLLLDCVGITFGGISCLLVSGTPEEVNGPGWRTILEVSFGLSLLHFLLVVFYLPESPAWLLSRGRAVDASEVLQILHGPDCADVLDLLREWDAGYIYLEENDDNTTVAEQKHSHPKNLSADDVERGDRQMTFGDPLLTVSGDECLTTEEEDRKSNADASQLTIVTVT